MSIVQNALLAVIAALTLALGWVGWQDHSRGVQLELMTAARDTLSARLGEVAAVNATNQTTIADLREANAANSTEAEQAQKRADDANAKLAVTLDQLATVQRDSAKRSTTTYANDEAVKQWGDVPVPRALADELRDRAARM